MKTIMSVFVTILECIIGAALALALTFGLFHFGSMVAYNADVHAKAEKASAWSLGLESVDDATRSIKAIYTYDDYVNKHIDHACDKVCDYIDIVVASIDDILN